MAGLERHGDKMLDGGREDDDGINRDYTSLLVFSGVLEAPSDGVSRKSLVILPVLLPPFLLLVSREEEFLAVGLLGGNSPLIGVSFRS